MASIKVYIGVFHDWLLQLRVVQQTPPFSKRSIYLLVLLLCVDYCCLSTTAFTVANHYVVRNHNSFRQGNWRYHNDHVSFRTACICLRSLALTTTPPTWNCRQSKHGRSSSSLQNLYDDWRSGTIEVIDTMIVNDDNIIKCLDEFIESDYGKQMFGRHELASSIGITGDIKFIKLNGSEVTVQLSGQFWHRRETIMKRATRWLITRFPSSTINIVKVDHPDGMFDYDECIDPTTGTVVSRIDKRSPDYNDHRRYMEDNGIDPDIYGPFSSEWKS